MEKEKCVIAYGNAFDGLDLIGPFESSEDANRYADLYIVVEWVVVFLEEPSE